MERKPYLLQLTKSEADAIFWHDGRYAVSDFLQKHLVQNEVEDSQWELSLTEAQAWMLRELWDEEGPLACGSSELNEKLNIFCSEIV